MWKRLTFEKFSFLAKFEKKMLFVEKLACVPPQVSTLTRPWSALIYCGLYELKLHELDYTCLCLQKSRESPVDLTGKIQEATKRVNTD